MVHSDPNVNIAIERPADRVRAFQVYGQTYRPASAAPSCPMDDAHRSRRPAGLMKAGFVMVVLAIGMVMAVVANTGWACGLVTSLVR
jgi:hypothetical protein